MIKLGFEFSGFGPIVVHLTTMIYNFTKRFGERDDVASLRLLRKACLQSWPLACIWELQW